MKKIPIIVREKAEDSDQQALDYTIKLAKETLECDEAMLEIHKESLKQEIVYVREYRRSVFELKQQLKDLLEYAKTQKYN